MKIKIIPNILSREGRSEFLPEWKRGKTVREYLKDYKIKVRGHRVIVSGKKIKNLGETVRKDDEIIVTPIVKDPFSIGLATLAIIGITSAGVETAAFALTATIVGWAVIGAVVGIATLAIVSAFSQPRKPGNGTNASGLDASSPTYGWDGVQTSQNVGTPVPVIYGKHKVGGNVVNQFITNDGDKNYLHTLLALGEGEIEDVSNICINDNPIANFSGVTTAQVMGTNSQAPIPDFEILHDINAVAVNLNNLSDAHVYTMAGTDITGFEVLITFPSGLYSISSQGAVGATSVQVKIEYKLHAAGSYTLLDTFTLSESNRSSVRRIFQKTGLAAGQYDIRVTRMTAAGDNMYTISDMTWTHLDELQDDSVAYPNTALLALNFLATDQLSGGTPNLTCIVKGRKIKTPDIRVSMGGASVAYDDYYYDSTSSQWKKLSDSTVLYWDGTTYVTAYSANPAWVIYDLLTNTRFGLGEFISTTNVNLASFVEMAQYCDGKVGDGNGGYEKRFRMDLVLDSETRSIDALMQLATTFRAIFFFSENTIQLKIDKPELSVQMFTMGNIVADSFLQKWKSVKDVPNQISIQFLDQDKDYQQEMISYSDDAAIASGTPLRKKDVRLFCTRVSQAIREARYLLNFSKYVDRSISFKASIDALACQVGDVIDFAHDVPQWGYSGRVVSAASTSNITLDRTVSIAVGKTYVLQIRHGDDTLESHIVNNAVGSASVITVSTPFSFTPSPYDIYSFGEQNLAVKPFRIMALTRDQQNEVLITAVEYNASVYDDSAPALPTSNYSALDNTIEDVQDLALTEGVLVAGESAVQTIDVWFNRPDDSGRQAESRWSGAKVYLSDNNRVSWRLVGIATDTGFRIPGVSPSTLYYVALVSVAASGMENAITASPQNSITTTAGAAVTPPATISGFAGTFIGNNLKLSWTPLAIVPKGYEIRLANTNWGTANSDQIFQGVINSFQFLPSAPTGVTYYIKAFNDGGYATSAASITPSKAVPSNVAGLSASYVGTLMTLSWTNLATVPDGYEIRKNDSNWGTVDSNQVYVGTVNKVSFIPSASSGITYYVRALNWAGYSVTSGSLNPTMPVPTVPTGLSGMFQSSIIEFAWNQSPVIPAGYELRDEDANFGTVNAHQIYIGANLTFNYPATARSGVTFYLRSYDSFGNYSATSTSITPSNTAPAAITGVNADAPVLSTTRAFWTNSTDTDIVKYRVYKSETNVWGGEETIIGESAGLQMMIDGKTARASSVGAGTSGTVFTCPNLIGFANDYFVGDLVTFTSGALSAVSRYVSAFDGSTGKITLTVDAGGTPSAGDTLVINDVLYIKICGIDSFGEGAKSSSLQIIFTSITADMLGDKVVNARNMNVGCLSAISANMGCVTAGVMQGATIQTGSGGQRLFMNGSGIYGYDAACNNTLTINNDGSICATNIKLQDPACTCNYSFLSAGALKFHDACGDVPYVKRIASGSIATGGTVCLAGWTTVPQVLVSIKALNSYNSACSAQCQQWCVYADNPVCYTGASYGYCFTVHAALSLAVGQGSPVAKAVAFDVSACTATCVCSTDVCLCFQSWCNNAAPSNFYYGTICYAICYRKVGDPSYCAYCYSYVQAHASQAQMQCTCGVVKTIAFPCMAQWEILAHQVSATYTDSGICATTSVTCCSSVCQSATPCCGSGNYCLTCAHCCCCDYFRGWVFCCCYPQTLCFPGYSCSWTLYNTISGASACFCATVEGYDCQYMITQEQVLFGSWQPYHCSNWGCCHQWADCCSGSNSPDYFKLCVAQCTSYAWACECITWNFCVWGGYRCLYFCCIQNNGACCCVGCHCIQSFTDTYGCYCVLDPNGQLNWMAIAYT